MATRQRKTRLDNQIALYNRDAESAVLGSVLIAPDSLVTVRGFLDAGDFGDNSLGNVYRAMCSLADAGSPIDLVTLSNILEGRGASSDAVGHMIEAIGRTPTHLHIEQYARIVADLAVRRKLMQYSAEVMALATDESREARDVVGESLRRLQSVMQRSEGGMVAAEDVVHGLADEIERQIAAPGALWGMPTSLPDLDRLTNGLQPGVAILAGITHHGKTALATQISNHAATKGTGVAWFSMEMTARQMVSRFACLRARVSGDALQKGRMSGDELQRVYKAISEIQGLPIYLSDRACRDHLTLCSELARLRMKHEIGLVVIDHLHLMRPPKAERLDIAIGEIVGHFHQFGLDEGLPMLTLAQLNRSVHSRDVKIPAASDLRHSGAIEQDAGVIIFVHRPEVIYEDRQEAVPEQYQGIAVISVVKNRLSGETGYFPTNFKKGWGEFQSLVKDSRV